MPPFNNLRFIYTIVVVIICFLCAETCESEKGHSITKRILNKPPFDPRYAQTYLSFLPKVRTLVHRMNFKSADGIKYNAERIYKSNLIDVKSFEIVNKQHYKQTVKKKRYSINGSIPCFLCKAASTNTDMFSKMVALNLIKPNDTGTLMTLGNHFYIDHFFNHI